MQYQKITIIFNYFVLTLITMLLHVALLVNIDRLVLANLTLSILIVPYAVFSTFVQLIEQQSLQVISICLILTGITDQIALFTTQFFNLLIVNGFTQYVNSGTRRSNVLDLLLVDSSYLISYVSVLTPIGTSDHNSVLFQVNFNYYVYCQYQQGATYIPRLCQS